jgi:hypothetical protein
VKGFDYSERAAPAVFHRAPSARPQYRERRRA